MTQKLKLLTGLGLLLLCAGAETQPGGAYGAAGTSGPRPPTAGAGSRLPTAARARDARLNVLMLAVDDLRPELSPWGFTQIHTPHIDALAKRALAFTQAHVQQAVCSPTRTSLLTSRRPDHTRVYDLKHHFRDMGLRGITTLPEYFKLRGYTSTGMGKIFHPVADRVTGEIDDLCTPTMHNCSWTMMPSKGGQPYFHGDLEHYYQNGGADPAARPTAFENPRLAL